MLLKIWAWLILEAADKPPARRVATCMPNAERIGAEDADRDMQTDARNGAISCAEAIRAALASSGTSTDCRRPLKRSRKALAQNPAAHVPQALQHRAAHEGGHAVSAKAALDGSGTGAVSAALAPGHSSSRAWQLGWRMRVIRGCPQQKDVSSCGVFVLAYTDCILRGWWPEDATTTPTSPGVAGWQNAVLDFRDTAGLRLGLLRTLRSAGKC
jgi:Ulp1 protease family, C-terminal catalytic domain